MEVKSNKDIRFNPITGLHRISIPTTYLKFVDFVKDLPEYKRRTILIFLSGMISWWLFLLPRKSSLLSTGFAVSMSFFTLPFYVSLETWELEYTGHCFTAEFCWKWKLQWLCWFGDWLHECVESARLVLFESFVMKWSFVLFPYFYFIFIIFEFHFLLTAADNRSCDR